MNIRVCPPEQQPEQDNGRTIQLAEESGLKWLTRWAFVLRLPRLLYDTWREWRGLLFKAGIVTLLKVFLIVTRETTSFSTSTFHLFDYRKQPSGCPEIPQLLIARKGVISKIKMDLLLQFCTKGEIESAID